MADRFLTSKAAAEKANEAALAAMAEGVRGDLGQVTKAHLGLYRQLQDQSAQIAEVGEEARRTRLAVEQQEQKLNALERSIALLALWLKIGFVFLAFIAIVLLVQLQHGR